jgi:hypothetical protein
MYKISKDTDGIILLASNAESSREKHGVGSVLKPIPKNFRGRGAAVTSGTAPIPRQP